jgi:hypothetical protein
MLRPCRQVMGAFAAKAGATFIANRLLLYNEHCRLHGNGHQWCYDNCRAQEPGAVHRNMDKNGVCVTWDPCWSMRPGGVPSIYSTF